MASDGAATLFRQHVVICVRENRMGRRRVDSVDRVAAAFETALAGESSVAALDVVRNRICGPRQADLMITIGFGSLDDLVRVRSTLVREVIDKLRAHTVELEVLEIES